MILPAPATTPGLAATAPGNPGMLLGQDDFLRLLITQLRNQDPLNPLDQNEFLSQTAQFTALEHLMSINRALADLRDATVATGLAQAVSLLGKTARVIGRDVHWDGQHPAALGLTLEAPAAGVSIQVLDRDGQRVRELVTGPLEAGHHTLAWDGRDDRGRSVTPGTYFYRVEAAGGSTSAVAVEGVLTGFERAGTTLLFRLDDALVRQEDIVQLR